MSDDFVLNPVDQFGVAIGDETPFAVFTLGNKSLKKPTQS